MKILALDLGKYKTVGCAYESESGAHQFQRTFTAPAALERLVQEVKPDRVVIEVCSIAGWVCDLLWQVGIEVQVANTSDDAWRWRNVKQKDDRRDALKAARLSAVNQLREVYIPPIELQCIPEMTQTVKKVLVVKAKLQTRLAADSRWMNEVASEYKPLR